MPAAGWTDLDAPGFTGAALAVGAGCAGCAGAAAVDAAGLACAAGLAGVEAPVLCDAGLALGAAAAGLGVGALPVLDPLDPPDGELDAAAGLGALELPPESELEPLDGEAAGFGAGLAPPEPPEGAPAILATVRTATEDADTAGVAAEVAVFAGASSVPSIHTNAAPPRSTDTDPAPHTRDRAAARIRTGNGRDAVGTGPGGTTRMRRPPAEATDSITNAPRVSHRDGRLTPVAGRPSRPRSSRVQRSRAGRFHKGVPGLTGTQLRPNRQPRSHHTEARPERGALRYIGTGDRHDLAAADQDYRDRHRSQPNFGKSQARTGSGIKAADPLRPGQGGQLVDGTYSNPAVFAISSRRPAVKRPGPVR